MRHILHPRPIPLWPRHPSDETTTRGAGEPGAPPEIGSGDGAQARNGVLDGPATRRRSDLLTAAAARRAALAVSGGTAPQSPSANLAIREQFLSLSAAHPVLTIIDAISV